MHPLERLVNLVALLLDARRPLTFEGIRELLPAYAQDDLATAKRMFERDKDTLRDIGIPIELAPTDAWEVEEGYVIRKEEYYLPEISFTPDEISALFVAARTGGEDTAAEQAVRKLLYGADGGVLAGVPRGPLAVGPESTSAMLHVVADAVSAQRGISFAYRTARGSTSQRRVDPYGLVWRAGHWYVVGLDLDQAEIRSFRLSRIQGNVEEAGPASSPPDGFRAADHARIGSWGPGEPRVRARVALSPEVAWLAIRSVQGAEVAKTRKDGWVEVRVPSAPGDGLASWILSFGPDAKVLSPASIRDEVVRRLEATLASL